AWPQSYGHRHITDLRHPNRNKTDVIMAKIREMWGGAQPVPADRTDGCHTWTVSSPSRRIFAGGRGDWSTTRPSTGIGCGVSRTTVTWRSSLPTSSRHALRRAEDSLRPRDRRQDRRRDACYQLRPEYTRLGVVCLLDLIGRGAGQHTEDVVPGDTAFHRASRDRPAGPSTPSAPGALMSWMAQPRHKKRVVGAIMTNGR